MRMELYGEFITDMPGILPSEICTLDQLLARGESVHTLCLKRDGSKKSIWRDGNAVFVRSGAYPIAICETIPETVEIKHLLEAGRIVFEYLSKDYDPDCKPVLSDDNENILEICGFQEGNPKSVHYARELSDGSIQEGSVHAHQRVGELKQVIRQFHWSIDWPNRHTVGKEGFVLTDHGIATVEKKLLENPGLIVSENRETGQYTLQIEGKQYGLVIVKTEWWNKGYIFFEPTVPRGAIIRPFNRRSMVGYRYMLEREGRVDELLDNPFLTIEEEHILVIDGKQDVEGIIANLVNDIFQHVRGMRDHLFDGTFFRGVKKEDMEFALGLDDGLHTSGYKQPFDPTRVYNIFKMAPPKDYGEGPDSCSYYL